MRRKKEDDILTMKLKEAKRKLILSLVGLSIFALSTFLTFIWFDWKLFIVVLLFVLGNNISIFISYVIPLQKSINLIVTMLKLKQ